MSFQDVGKKRQHPIFDKHRLSSSSATAAAAAAATTTSSNTRNNQRSVPPPVDARRNNKRTTKSGSGSGSGSGASIHIPDVAALGNHSSSSSSKSVRPRLSTSCPVTKRNLLRVEDDKSQLSGSTNSTTTTTTTSEEEDVMEDPVVVRRKKYSPATHSLTNELQQFQKMVSELEHVFAQASSSPEAQWKSRILVRSVQDVDRDLGTKVYQVQSRDQSLEARKWMRDYIRMHKELQGLLQKQLRQQQADISLLTAGQGNMEQQKVMQEEYFDRIMREREQEVQQIQFSMDQVNAIYQDLAAMVDGQQDQIDLLADRAEESKAYTESGLEQIQEAMMGWCSPDTTSTSTGTSNSRNRNGMDESNGHSPTRRNRQPLHANGGGGGGAMQNQWVVLNPHTLQDIQVLKQGVMDKGQAMMDEIQDTVMDYSTCQCLSDNNTTTPPDPSNTSYTTAATNTTTTTTTTTTPTSRTYEYTAPRVRSSSRGGGRENREPTRRRSSSRSRRSY